MQRFSNFFAWRPFQKILNFLRPQIAANYHKSMVIGQCQQTLATLKNNLVTLKWVVTKQWPLAPNLQEWQINCANVSRRFTFFPEMAFGECGRVWEVREKQVGECRQVWRVQAKQVGKCRRVWRVLAKPCQMLAHDKVGRFKHKYHILYV